MKHLASILKFMLSLKTTVLCLAWLIVLVFVGTLYQKEYGLYLAQDKFFYSWFTDFDMGGFRIWIPSGLLTMTILTVNLFASLMFHFTLGLRVLGVLVIHIGVLLMFIGGAAIYWSAEETFLPLEEGQAWNIGQSSMEWELALTESLDSARTVSAITIDGVEAGETLVFDDMFNGAMKLRVEVESYCGDANMQWNGREDFEERFDYLDEEIMRQGIPARDLNVVISTMFPGTPHGMFPTNAVAGYEEKPPREKVLKKYAVLEAEEIDAALKDLGSEPVGGFEYFKMRLRTMISLEDKRYLAIQKVKQTYKQKVSKEARHNDPQQRWPGLVATVKDDVGNSARLVADGMFGHGFNLYTPITLGDKTYYFKLHKKRVQLPFLMTLNDFERSTLPNQSADKGYASRVTVKHFTMQEGRDGQLKEEATISMNQPYRSGPWTAYQTSFSQENAKFSTLTVKRTYGWRLPYVATFIAFAGLAIHFLQLLYYQAKRQARTT